VSANILLLKEKSTLHRAPLIDERKNRLYKIIFIFRIIITEIEIQPKEQSVVKKIITLLPENIDPVALKNKPVRANENNRKVISDPTIDAFSVKFHAIIEKDSTSNHLAILLINPAIKRSLNRLNFQI
tara:strand:- start:49 stop:432 length:384 start_codon:yes stop_codon:yes gene_type:complete